MPVSPHVCSVECSAPVGRPRLGGHNEWTSMRSVPPGAGGWQQMHDSKRPSHEVIRSAVGSPHP